MRRVTPLAERFWAKVNRHGPEHQRLRTRCWLWTGSTRNGYGQIGLGRASEGVDYAHRVSWRLYRGPIPPGLHVLHKCDVPACVRPSHLFLGTQADNQQDKTRKGRHPRTGARTKLARADVLAIRNSDLAQVELAILYDIDPSHVSKIRSGRAWKEVQ